MTLKGLDGIEGLSDDQIAKINQIANPLISKKEELEAKLHKVKTGNESNVSELERLRQLENNIKLKEQEDQANYQAALAELKKQQASEVERLQSSVSEKESALNALITNNGLQQELIKLNVNPALLPMIQSGLAGLVEIVEGKATIDGESLSDYMTTWAESDAGKAARLATANNGGNANGSGDTGPTKKKMSELSNEERVDMYNNNRAEFDRLAEEQKEEQRQTRGF